nr:helix-turn-helix domain-containing protein [Moraxella atlantae]
MSEGKKQYQTAVYQQRCHLMFLKSQGYKAQDIADILGTNIQSVYNWVKLIMDELTEQTGKQFSQCTFERFLKVLATPTNACVCD